MTQAASPRRVRCVALLEELSMYLDGELSAKQCQVIEAHLDRCPCCGHLADRLRRAVAICRASGMKRLPGDVRRRAKARITELLSEGPLAAAGSAGQGARRKTRARRVSR